MLYLGSLLSTLQKLEENHPSQICQWSGRSVIAACFVKFKVGLSLVSRKMKDSTLLTSHERGSGFPSFHSTQIATCHTTEKWAFIFKELRYVISLSKYFPSNFKLWSLLATQLLALVVRDTFASLSVFFSPTWAHTRCAKGEFSAAAHALYSLKLLFSSHHVLCSRCKTSTAATFTICL